MISTATALTSAKVSAGDGPNHIHVPKVRIAATNTAGTKYIVTLSTSAWIGSFDPCASSTMRMICDRTVLPPTAVARMANAPFWFTVPATTSLPCFLETGIGSPVIIDSST